MFQLFGKGEIHFSQEGGRGTVWSGRCLGGKRERQRKKTKKNTIGGGREQKICLFPRGGSPTQMRKPPQQPRTDSKIEEIEARQGRKKKGKPFVRKKKTLLGCFFCRNKSRTRGGGEKESSNGVLSFTNIKNHSKKESTQFKGKKKKEKLRRRGGSQRKKERRKAWGRSCLSLVFLGNKKSPRQDRR